mmetsp:Transcript_6384/g.18794  ORF Transcript_6384/g.18794 Transcript_6384/m.18794 type:complete len:712 (-) Transcript_6384:52-2187(-)
MPPDLLPQVAASLRSASASSSPESRSTSTYTHAMAGTEEQARLCDDPSSARADAGEAAASSNTGGGGVASVATTTTTASSETQPASPNRIRTRQDTSLQSKDTTPVPVVRSVSLTKPLQALGKSDGNSETNNASSRKDGTHPSKRTTRKNRGMIAGFDGQRKPLKSCLKKPKPKPLHPQQGAAQFPASPVGQQNQIQLNGKSPSPKIQNAAARVQLSSPSHDSVPIQRPPSPPPPPPPISQKGGDNGASQTAAPTKQQRPPPPPVASMHQIPLTGLSPRMERIMKYKVANAKQQQRKPRAVRFAPKIHIRPTIHVADMSDQLVDSVWYTYLEYRAMKNEVHRTAQAIMSGRDLLKEEEDFYQQMEAAKVKQQRRQRRKLSSSKAKAAAEGNDAGSDGGGSNSSGSNTQTTSDANESDGGSSSEESDTDDDVTAEEKADTFDMHIHDEVDLLCPRGCESKTKEGSRWRSQHKLAAWIAVLDEQDRQYDLGVYCDWHQLSYEYQMVTRPCTNRALIQGMKDQQEISDYLQHTREAWYGRGGGGNRKDGIVAHGGDENGGEQGHSTDATDEQQRHDGEEQNNGASGDNNGEIEMDEAAATATATMEDLDESFASIDLGKQSEATNQQQLNAPDQMNGDLPMTLAASTNATTSIMEGSAASPLIPLMMTPTLKSATPSPGDTIQANSRSGNAESVASAPSDNSSTQQPQAEARVA